MVHTIKLEKESTGEFLIYRGANKIGGLVLNKAELKQLNDLITKGLPKPKRKVALDESNSSSA